MAKKSKVKQAKRGSPRIAWSKSHRRERFSTVIPA